MLDRRLFARGLLAAPAIASPALASPVLMAGAAPAPALEPVSLAAYVAFLAHEHRAALHEMHPDHYARVIADGGTPCYPMFWFPDDPAAVAAVASAPPSTRAATVMRAVALAPSTPR